MTDPEKPRKLADLFHIFQRSLPTEFEPWSTIGDLRRIADRLEWDDWRNRMHKGIEPYDMPVV